MTSPTRSGYIEAIGKRAAAEAINRAKVEVAQQDRDGATGQKDAQRDQRVRVAALEATAIEGEVKSKRDYEIATAEREAETIAAKKNAEQEQRVQVAAAESTAVQGENSSQGEIANSNAQLAEVRAEAKRRAEIAAAQADEAIFGAQREQEIARLGKDELAPQEIEKERVEIKAEATAEQLRREARGEADAMLAKFVGRGGGYAKGVGGQGRGVPETGRGLRRESADRSDSAHDRAASYLGRRAGEGDSEPQDRQDHCVGFGERWSWIEARRWDSRFSVELDRVAAGDPRAGPSRRALSCRQCWAKSTAIRPGRNPRRRRLLR